MAEESVANRGNVTDGIADGPIGDFIFGKQKEAPEPEIVEDEAPDDEVDAQDEVEASEEVSDDEDVSEEASEEPEFVEVEYDGQLYEVPPQLKDALLRQSDYTAKTQEVANQRKQHEVILGEVEQVKAQYNFAQEVQPDIIKAQQLESQISEARKYLKENLDQLGGTDIERIRIAIEDAQNERNEIAQGLQTKAQEFQQAQEQSKKELLKKGTEVLRSRISDWDESHNKQVIEYGLSNGFTEAELNSVSDPRQVEVLWKASQYDKLQSGKTAAVKKAQTAPTIKPKARNPMPKEVGKKLNLRKTLKSNKSDKDKGKALGQHLADRFNM